jgi:hypothetical protein
MLEKIYLGTSVTLMGVGFILVTFGNAMGLGVLFMGVTLRAVIASYEGR